MLVFVSLCWHYWDALWTCDFHQKCVILHKLCLWSASFSVRARLSNVPWWLPQVFVPSLQLAISVSASKGQCDGRPSDSLVLSFESAQIILVQKHNFNGLSLSKFWKNLKILFTAIFLAKLLHPTLEDCSFMPHTSSFAVPLGYWRTCLWNQVPLRDSVFFFCLALLNIACPCRPSKLLLHTFARSVFTYQNQKINTALAPL